MVFTPLGQGPLRGLRLIKVCPVSHLWRSLGAGGSAEVRHEVVWMAVSTVKCYETCYSTNSTLSGYATVVTQWCKAPETTEPQLKLALSS